ncbi:MAG TPA: hypothetical protein VEQ42_02350 [Pyrinomonadaceae bacterium]|nr:hypothetical protein [Pyrinomonadaceae bacterium]
MLLTSPRAFVSPASPPAVSFSSSRARQLAALCAVACALLAPLSGARAATHARQQNSAPAVSPSPDLPRGRLVKQVPTVASAAQTYALYLPSNYTPERRWPVLYCFDPAARGHVPVERFREAAERYGWIVVGSNNSRNGPLQPSLEATKAMWDDTHARLSIDAGRVYASGFSGGARVAVRLAYLCRNCLAGVVAVGGGFPVGVEPSREVAFALFGVAGTDDFNFPEMRRLDDTLARLDFPRRLELFEGGHAWAPATLMSEAVEWFELQAMRSNRRALDEALLEELWRKAGAKARASEEAKRLYEAYRIYQAGASDFRGLRDVSEFERRAKELRATKEVRRALDEEGGQVRRQQQLAQEAVMLARQKTDAENGAIAFADFRRLVADLRKTSRGAEDTGERRVARRVLHQVFAQFYESAANLRARGVQNSTVASELELAAEVSPDNPQLHFELACAHARNGDKRKALEALGRAAEKGFKDAAELARNEALAPLRAEPAFKELLEKLSGTKP